MYYGYKVSDYTANLARKAEEDCREVFKKIDENTLFCSAKVLNAFQYFWVLNLIFSTSMYKKTRQNAMMTNLSWDIAALQDTVMISNACWMQ